MKPSLSDKFWKRVKKTDYCWLWTGSSVGVGYGQFNHPRGNSAHRFSWELHHGKIPKGMLVCHKCDIRNCVNPSHLFLGTQKDNLLDMYKKGRGINGIKNGQAKLTDAKVRAIIKIYRMQLINDEAIARAFLVNSETIRNIVKRKTWNHVIVDTPNTRSQ